MLTIVSVVGIAPTLVASMYGMNFHNIPELSWRWGYQYGLALIALSTVMPIVVQMAWLVVSCRGTGLVIMHSWEWQ